MAVPRVAAGIVVLVVGLVLWSSTIVSASPAVPKVVVLACFYAPTLTVYSCDESTSVSASCPTSGSSCAQAVATFEAPPDNLKLIQVLSSGPGYLVIYHLSHP